MAYLVELTLRAERDLAYLYDRISGDDSIAAVRWFKELEQAIYTLERFPRRCPLAPERAERRSAACGLCFTERSVTSTA